MPRPDSAAPLALRQRSAAPPAELAPPAQPDLFPALLRQAAPVVAWHSAIAWWDDCERSARYAAQLLELRQAGDSYLLPPPAAELVAFQRDGRWYWRAPAVPAGAREN